MGGDKTNAEKAHEDGQRDGSKGNDYSGWAYGDEQDNYNAGYRNGRDNPSSDD